MRNGWTAHRVIVLKDLDTAVCHIEVPGDVAPDSDRQRSRDAIERIDHDVAAVATGVSDPHFGESEDAFWTNERNQPHGEGSWPEHSVDQPVDESRSRPRATSRSHRRFIGIPLPADATCPDRSRVRAR